MSKSNTLPFKFSIPVSGINKQKSQSLLNTSLKVIMIDELIIEGNGYDFGRSNPQMEQYSSLITKVIWKGHDLLPLFQAVPSLKLFLNEVRTAAHHHVETYLFTQTANAITNNQVYEEANY